MLSWNEVPGAISYNVYGSTSPGVTKLSGSKIRNATNPLTINELEPGKTYYFVVTVVNELGESEESSEEHLLMKQRRVTFWLGTKSKSTNHQSRCDLTSSYKAKNFKAALQFYDIRPASIHSALARGQ